MSDPTWYYLVGPLSIIAIVFGGLVIANLVIEKAMGLLPKHWRKAFEDLNSYNKSI